MKPSSIKRLTNLEKAIERLQAMAARPKEEATRDSVIKKFELAFELAWKVMKDFNDEKGLLSANPKDTIRIAADNGLIDDPALWLKFLGARNNAAHIYDEALADALYEIIKTGFLKEAVLLLGRVREKSSES